MEILTSYNYIICQTPARWPRPAHTDQLRFDVTVRLPASSGGPPLRIKGFETDLPLFAHKVGDLRGAVDFQTLSLKTSDMPIIVEVRLVFHLRTSIRS